MIDRATFDLIFLPRQTSEPEHSHLVSDAQLVERCLRAHDEDAYALLARRYGRRAVHAAAAVLGPALQHEAEDAAQDAFMRAFERLHTLKAKDRFGAWVCRLAFNRAVDIRRLARARRAHVDVTTASLPAEAEGPHDLAAASEVRRHVRNELDALPDMQRSVLHLHYWLEYGIDEIADLLGIPSGTVKSHLHRGRTRLANRIKD